MLGNFPASGDTKQQTAIATLKKEFPVQSGNTKQNAARANLLNLFEKNFPGI